MNKRPVEGALFRVAEALDLPADMVTGASRVEITGARDVLVTNHGGIIEYTPELITLAGSGAAIAIHGAELELVSMSAEELSLRGRIFSVEFRY